MKRPIVIWPDPILAAPNVPIVFDEQSKKELHELLTDLRDCIWHYNALGIAAPQIGVNKTVMLVMKGYSSTRPEIIEMINPEILDLSAKMVEGEEGCLSFPGEAVTVKRHDYLRVKYFDRDGIDHILDTANMEPLLSVEIQHEYDHLSGRTLADYVGPMRKDVMRRRLRRAKQAQDIVWDRVRATVPAYKFEEFK